MFPAPLRFNHSNAGIHPRLYSKAIKNSREGKDIDSCCHFSSAFLTIAFLPVASSVRGGDEENCGDNGAKKMLLIVMEKDSY